MELVLPSQLTSPLAGPALGCDVGGGVAVGPGGGVFVGGDVGPGGSVFVGSGVGCGVDVGCGVLVGADVGGGVEPPPLKVAFTERTPSMMTKDILLLLSSVPVQDSQA